MAKVTIRELRNHGGDVLARVARGETLTVTRDGEPVAQVSPLPRRPAPVTELIERRRHLPHVDAAALLINADALPLVSGLAGRLTGEELLDNIAHVEKADQTIEMNVNKSLTLEAMAFKLHL